MCSCPCLIARRELVRVETAGNDADALALGAIQVQQVLPILWAFGDDPIRLGDDLVPTSYAAQSVESDNQRQTQRFFQLDTNQCRHEEMSMYDIVADPPGTMQGELRKFSHKREYLFLGPALRRAGGDMDDVYSVEPFQDLRQIRTIAACQDFDVVAAPRQMTCRVSNVDVLAATVRAAQFRPRRSVFTNHGDTHSHQTSPLFRSARGRFVTRVNVSSQSLTKRSIPNRSRARRRAFSPSRRAKAGSANNCRIGSYSRRMSVSRKP